MERDRADRGFGDLLREYRAAAGLSQESLADRARLSPGAVSALERGARRGPQRETLERLADALELDPGRRERLARAAAAGRQRPIRSGMRSEPPAPNNLPQLLTSFHGREGELAEFERIVGRRRLVTLLGAGGVGKTRLALEIAHRQLPTGRFADGVWVVDLAPLGATGLVASALARVLGIAERPGEALSQTIVGMLAAKTMLVLFDNCEHVLAECAVLIEALLARCPGLTILATTREALGVDGECVVRVGSLPYDDTLAGPAFDLLVDRLADADYQKFSTISEDDRQHIATICRRLDGVPLALELAAARAGDVGLAEIVSGLDRRFTLLNKGRRTAPPRHYSLRGMIDWSFALLDPAERALFAQLGLFAGSFSAEAAAAVGERDVRETLAALVAKSLLTAVPGDAGRYRLSETRRAYALDRLREGEAGDASARRFAAHYAAVAKAADARYGRMPNDDFLAMVEPDIDNFRAALEWTLGLGNDVRLGAELAGSMGFIYRQTALFVEGTGWAERALAAAPDAEPQVAARLHMALAFFSFNVGGMGRTLDEAVAAEALYRQAGSAAGLAWALATQAFALYRLERPEDLRVAAEAAVRVGREAGDPLRLGSALTAFALSLTEDRAVERFAALEEALQCCRDAGDTDAIVPTAHLAAAYYEAGDFARALAHVSDVAAKARKNRDRTTLASALVNVASYALALDDVAHAEAAAREALTLVRDFGKTLNAMCGLQLLGSVAGCRGDHVRAARLAGAADRLYREFDLRREAMEQTIHARTLHDATAALGPERVRSLLAEGAALPLGRAIDEALAPLP